MMDSETMDSKALELLREVQELHDRWITAPQWLSPERAKQLAGFSLEGLTALCFVRRLRFLVHKDDLPNCLWYIADSIRNDDKIPDLLTFDQAVHVSGMDRAFVEFLVGEGILDATDGLILKERIAWALEVMANFLTEGPEGIFGDLE